MRRRTIILFVVAGLLVVAGLSTWWAKKRAENAMLAFAGHVDEVRDAAIDLDGPRTRASYEAARSDLARARSARRWPTARVAAILPWFKGSTDSFDRLTLAADEMLAAAERGTHAVGLVDGTSGRRLVDAGRIDLGVLAEIKADVTGALAALDRAEQRVAQVRDFPLLPGLPRVRQVATEQIERTRASLAEVPEIIDQLPPILGAAGRRSYYFGIQNIAELRGSGGGLLVYILVHVEQGQVTVENFGSVYAFETEDPGLRHPFDFQWRPDDFWSASIPDIRRLGNTNWSPHFPSVGHNVVELFRVQTGGREIDGTVAVTPAFLELMLKVVGPVKVEGRDEPFTAENLTEFVIKDAYGLKNAEGDPDQERRRSINALLLEQTMQRLLQAPDMGVFWQGLRPILPGLAMQVYLTRPEEQALVMRLDLDGGIVDTEADYSAVVINNTAGNKNDWFMRHEISQDVTLDGEGTAAEVLTHRFRNDGPPNPGPPGTRLTEYYDHFSDTYTAAYVPGRASIESQELQSDEIPSPLPVINQEAGKTAVVRGIRIVPGNTGTYTVRYTVPAAATQGPDGVWTYRLVRQRPARLDPDLFALTVRLPAGATPVDADGWTRAADGAWSRTAEVVGVETFELRYRVG